MVLPGVFMLDGPTVLLRSSGQQGHRTESTPLTVNCTDASGEHGGISRRDR